MKRSGLYIRKLKRTDKAIGIRDKCRLVLMRDPTYWDANYDPIVLCRRGQREIVDVEPNVQALTHWNKAKKVSIRSINNYLRRYFKK